MKNRILATEASPTAIPVKPNTAASKAKIKNRITRRNILCNLIENYLFSKISFVDVVMVYALMWIHEKENRARNQRLHLMDCTAMK